LIWEAEDNLLNERGKRFYDFGIFGDAWVWNLKYVEEFMDLRLAAVVGNT
jgi:hypothetical protein